MAKHLIVILVISSIVALWAGVGEAQVLAVEEVFPHPTILASAAKTLGAVCLDGSPPVYYLRRGSGT